MQKIIGNSATLDRFFPEGVMSLHLKENTHFTTKEGTPGEIEVTIHEELMTKEKIFAIVDGIFAEVEERDDGFLEIDRKLLKIVQLGPYRIVIVYPPLADGMELTIVKPVVKLSLDDYDLEPEIRDYLENEAQGVLISGSPGSGKTTFAQSILEQHLANKKICKTIESPRDLLVADEIVQYSFSYGSHNDIRDILFLSRPDFCVFDEVRNVDDFMLFKDLRLTGVGLLGVIHATRAIDGVQRFLGHIELGVIPQMIDTILYVTKGGIEEILQLKLVVKVPHGMASADLARPVIQVFDFRTKAVVYEIYSFGEQIVVMPLEDVEESPASSAMAQHALGSIKRDLAGLYDFDFLLGAHGSSLEMYVPDQMKPRVIGTKGSNIQALEKTLGMSISVKSFADLPLIAVDYDAQVNSKGNRMVIQFTSDLSGRDIGLLIGDDIMQTRVDQRSSINVVGKNKVSRLQRRGFVVVDMSQLV